MLKYLMNKYNELQAKKDEGFTLIELVIVIVIIAILALIMVPGITGYINKADESKAQANLRSMYTNIQLIEAETGKTMTTLDKDAFDGYVKISESELAKYTYEGGTLKLEGKGDREYTFDGEVFGGDFSNLESNEGAGSGE